MSLLSLRRYDVQAKYAAILAGVSTPPVLVAAYLLLRNYHADLGQIVYGAQGSFVLALSACVLLSTVPGALGFVFGWSSAGQRRNDKPVCSWIGFFLGGGVVTLNLIILIAFSMLRIKSPG